MKLPEMSNLSVTDDRWVKEFNETHLSYLGRDRILIGQVLLSQLILDHFLDRYLAVTNPELSAARKARMGFSKKWQVKRVPAFGGILHHFEQNVLALNRLRNKIAHDLNAQVLSTDIAQIKDGFLEWIAASGRALPDTDVEWLIAFTQHISFFLDGIAHDLRSTLHTEAENPSDRATSD